MTYSFARRLDEATVTIACGDETHTVTANLDGTITLHQHDADAEAVYTFLGGEATACQRAANMIEAVFVADRARRGIDTLSDYTFIRRVSGWGPREVWVSSTASHCPNCAATSRTRTSDGVLRSQTSHYGHLLSPEHIAAAHGTSSPLVRKVAAWVTSRIPDPDRLTVTKARALSQDYSRALSPTQIRDYNLTPRFMNAVSRLPGMTPFQFDALNVARAGLTAPWLNEFLDEVTPEALTRAGNFHGERGTLVNALSSARNTPARTVAQFMNGGIYSNFYTYNKFRVTPMQALQVYRASGGTYNLATALRRGLSISQALDEAITEGRLRGTVPA